ncbi:MAG: hypothetical protein AABZ36_08205 [Nitrospirota bacterium]
MYTEVQLLTSVTVPIAILVFCKSLRNMRTIADKNIAILTTIVSDRSSALDSLAIKYISIGEIK